jgi:hypothetical protein
MKVRFTLPVRGVLRVQAAVPISLNAWSFEFRENDNGFVDQICIEIDQIPEENWPTISESKIKEINGVPVFPFVRNPTAVSFQEIKDKILKLEGYLAPFGLTAIDFNLVKEEWFPGKNDKEVSLFSGFSLQKGTPEPICDPIGIEFTSKLIVASNLENNIGNAVSYFRMAQFQLMSGYYIESIRYFYFFFEFLFGNGKHKKTQVLAEFDKSQKFKDYVQRQVYKEPSNEFLRTTRKYETLAKNPGSYGFFEFLFDLRGAVQHASKNSPKRWHPSLQEEFEDEAVCLMHLAEVICFDLVVEHTKEVKYAASAGS